MRQLPFSPDEVPQHQQLLRTFQELKQRDFPELGQVLFELARHVAPGLKRSDSAPEIAWIQSLLPDDVRAGTILGSRDPLCDWRNVLIAWIQSLLAGDILKEASRLLHKRGSIPETALTRAAENRLKEALRFRRGQSSKNFHQRWERAILDMTMTAKRGQELVEKLAQVTPPGRLDFPGRGKALRPARHEPLPGYPAEGKILLLLFPAYVVSRPDGQEDVVEKAQVITCQAEVPGSLNEDFVSWGTPPGSGSPPAAAPGSATKARSAPKRAPAQEAVTFLDRVKQFCRRFLFWK
jgi:hypothetical protein